jgi:hypothetical protein
MGQRFVMTAYTVGARRIPVTLSAGPATRRAVSIGKSVRSRQTGKVTSHNGTSRYFGFVSTLCLFEAAEIRITSAVRVARDVFFQNGISADRCDPIRRLRTARMHTRGAGADAAERLKLNL